jgi:hypothetical protein
VLLLLLPPLLLLAASGDREAAYRQKAKGKETVQRSLEHTWNELHLRLNRQSYQLIRVEQGW